MSPPQVSGKESVNADAGNLLMDCKVIESSENVENNFIEPANCDVNIDLMSAVSECTKIDICRGMSENLLGKEQSKTVAGNSNDSIITESITSTLSTLSTEGTKVNLSTLVFFDLETTGLAKCIGKKNVQIIEISMIAVGCKDFYKCTYPDLRDVRVVQKLSLCVKPRSSVSREAACITGLTNANLQDQGHFDVNTATLITCFLSHLKKPACILAHNGKLFDFPILKSEFENLNMPLPSDVYIVDTLIGFRKFGMPELPMNQKLHKDVKFKLNGNISYALQNLHLYFFGKTHVASHSSEGDCIALAKVCHKVRDRILPWIEENCFKFDTIVSMW